MPKVTRSHHATRWTDAINTHLGIVRATAGDVAAFSASSFEGVVQEVILGVDALRSASSQSDGVAVRRQ
jgi:hypothetical protein